MVLDPETGLLGSLPVNKPLDWRICDRCGHRFPFKGNTSIVVPDPDDVDGQGQMRREQWCAVCLWETTPPYLRIEFFG